MQNAHIGFYMDGFSLLLLFMVGMAAIGALFFAKMTSTCRWISLDTAYCTLAVICVVSFFAAHQSSINVQNLVIILGGCLWYIAHRHLRQSRVYARWILVVPLLCIGYASWQIAAQNRVLGVFSNENYYLGFLAIGVPCMVCRAIHRVPSSTWPRVCCVIVATISVTFIIMMSGRSALMGAGAGVVIILIPIFVFWWRKVIARLLQSKVPHWLFVGTILMGLCTVLLYVARVGYLIKPVSAAGRVLICSVATQMLAQAPIAGVGFGNFANKYGLFQAEYFAKGGGNVAQHMAADACRHAFNEPLEVAAELGLPGLVLLLLFAGLILHEVWKVVRRNCAALVGTSVVGAEGAAAAADGASVVGTSVVGAEGKAAAAAVKSPATSSVAPRLPFEKGVPRLGRGEGFCAKGDAGGGGGSIRGIADAGTVESEHRPPTADYLTLGMAGAVVCFMVMSLFHFPRKVVPTWLVFNYALAWVVTANQQHEQGAKESKRKPSICTMLAWRVFWLLAFLGSLALVPLYAKNYLDARRWIAAQEHIFAGNIARAYAGYTELYAKLKWSGRFCAYYGDAIMIAAETTNQHVCIEGIPEMRALALYEKAKYTYPDPYMFENLAVAYLRLANGTNWPVVVQTQYRMETPAQTLVRKVREWRCGTNLFFEPPATRLSQSDCIGRAIDYLTLASNILPWRLTSRWYLAQVYHDLGDVSNAVKYAQLVVNIPMKKDTPQGREFKRNAQKMLNELGVECDDPGMVVFDIHDRRTWNEGRW